MTTTQPITLTEFCKVHRITMKPVWVDKNPHMLDRAMDHWKVRFQRTWDSPTEYHKRATGERVHPTYHDWMTMYFSMGYGHNGAEPTAEQVLDCLASDASSVDGQTFEGWARDLGYDEDSRSAERIYSACERGAARLRRFLGDALYEQLLYGTERL